MRRALWAVGLLLVGWGCSIQRQRSMPSPIALGPVEGRELARRFQLPEPVSDSLRPLWLWATYYTLPVVSSVEGGHPLLDVAGNPLGPTLAPRDWCNAAMEGSVVVRSAKRAATYGFAGTGLDVQVDCTERYPRHPAIGRSRFQRARGAMGDGAGGYPLQPFRSVAVDPSVIPYGTVLFIPRARGVEVQLPLGPRVVHDGYFLAADTGGAIKRTHIDIFLGPTRKNPFSFVSSRPSGGFQAFIVRSPELKQALEAQHRPIARDEP